MLQVITGMEDEVVKLIEDYTHPKIRKVHLLKDSFGAPLFPGYIFVEMELDSDTYRPVWIRRLWFSIYVRRVVFIR